MGPDLTAQLRAYATRLDQAAPALEYLLHPGLVSPPVRRVSPRRRWLPAMVAALAVLLVVGGIGFLTRISEPIGTYGSPTAFRATIERRIPAEAVAAELAAIAEEQLLPPPTEPTADRVVVVQLSFDGSQGWRLDFLSDSFPMPGRPEESVGSFWVTDGRQSVQYWAETNTATDAPDFPPSPLNLLTWDGTPIAQEFWAEHCPDPEILSDEQVAGRLSRHIRCEVWELWVDAETGLILRLRLAPGSPVPVPTPRPLGVAPGETLEVTELEYSPNFAEGTFELAAPPGAEPPGEEIPQNVTRFVVGEGAPTWTAPLLSGGELDLASLRGEPVALLFWASWCPPCLEDGTNAEGLTAPFAPFEAAYRDHRDEVNFVSVAYEDESEFVRDVVEQTGHQVPVVLLTPGETGEGWVVLGIPTLIFLDEEGHFLGGYSGVLPSAEDLAGAIDALAAGEPLPELFIPETGQWP
ncbi:MAG: TlpA disulfide reductase family protein [Acidimicrobiia bacterium]